MEKNSNKFVSLNHIYKVYPNGVEAVHDFNLDIKKHEFIVIVGPSGCGKSTTLRMVAGLEDISEGQLYIDGVLSNDETPKDRNIAMVFQSYSLYPHMSVYDNISFGIRMRKYPVPVLDKNGQQVTYFDKKLVNSLQKENANINKRLISLNECVQTIENFPNKDKYLEKKLANINTEIASLNKKIEENEAKIQNATENYAPKFAMKHLKKDEVEKQVHEVAKILELEEYLERKPAQLSGGQRQRVALGRSIIRNAKVFLMDEPLSNLDAKLRGVMRSEIIKLHERLNATIIYVTHDQTEAMTMASRIVVMKDGYIQQIGTPEEVYQCPANTFVANFIGSPAMNIIEGTYANDAYFFEDNQKIALDKEFKKAHDDFYKARIAHTNHLSDLLDTTTEEDIINVFTIIKDLICKDYANVEETKARIIDVQNKMISKYFERIENNHLYQFVSSELENGESENWANKYNEFKAYITQNFKTADLDEMLNHPYFSQNSNKFIAKWIDDEKTDFLKIISLIKVNIDFVKTESSPKEFALKAFDMFKDKFDALNKENVDAVTKKIKEVKEVVEKDIIKADVDTALNSLEKELKNINNLNDSSIRELYFTCERAKGISPRLDFVLNLVDESRKSKKLGNRLRNTFILKTMIEELTQIFERSLKGDHKILFGIRPEDFHLYNDIHVEKYGKTTLSLEVSIAELLGREYILHMNIGQKELLAQLGTQEKVEMHEKVKLIIDMSKVHFFDSITTSLIK